MTTDFTAIGLGFIEGIALILSPCILPILPIILSGSLAGSKKRPFGIIVGFVCVFALMTFFSRKLVQLTGIDLNILRYLSFGLLILLGLVMISSFLTEKFAQLTQGLSQLGASNSTLNDNEGGWMSGVVFGALIALIWTPCAGPILAAVIVQTVVSESDFIGFLTIVAFAIGAGVPMLLIALFGRSAISRFGYLKSHTDLIRKLIGAVIIFSVIFTLYFDQTSATIVTNQRATNTATQLKNGLRTPYSAPEISGIEKWINSPPLTIADLKGKVVLIDFWAYSCINCIRTMPYLIEWYRQYHDQGFKIIGVHSPEFEFEKSFANVEKAVKQRGILYPVALDNQFITWRNYQNRFWPAHYLIDKNGQVVYTHFGEGEYEVTENNIRYLLGSVTPINKSKNTENFEEILTPETYLGYERANHYEGEPAVVRDQAADYHFPNIIRRDDWALDGKWKVEKDKIISEKSEAAIKLHFHAKKVFMVMGSSTGKPIEVSFILNNTTQQHKIMVEGHNLYDAVTQDFVADGILEVRTSSPGLEIYTFTFGE